MVKLILFLAFCALSAQAATYEGVKLHRLVRSPHYGAHYHYDHPPFGPPPLFPAPPPVIYRTHNWSGVGRGIDGAVKGVFSGAAAAAGSAVPTLNSAFSLAEAGSTNGGLGVDSTECDDNSHSSESKNNGQYNSKSSQYGSHHFGSGSGSNSGGGFGGSSGYSHSSFKESSSSFSQSGNRASNGYGQESNKGFGGQTTDDKNSRGELGYQGSNSGNGYKSFSANGQSHYGKLDQPQAQGSASNYGYFGASSHRSTQSGSSSFGAGGNANIDSQKLKSTEGTEQSFGHGAGLTSGQTGNNVAKFDQSRESSGFASGSNNYNSGAHGYGSTKLQTDGNGNLDSQQSKSANELGQSFEHGAGLTSGQTGNNVAEFDQSSGSSGFGSGSNNHNSEAHGYGSAKLQTGSNANLESQQLKSTTGVGQSFEHGAGLVSGQNGHNAAEFGQSSGSSGFGSGSSNYNSGASGYGSAKLQAGGSANFASQQGGVGSEHSFEHGAGLVNGQTANTATGFGQSSGLSSFGSGNKHHNSKAYDYGSTKLQGSGNANFESQQLKSTTGAEQSFKHGAGLASGQTGNNVAEFEQSSESNGFGSGNSNYNSGAHGYGSAKLQAGGSANFNSQQAGVGAEHSLEQGAGLTSGQSEINAAGHGQLGSTLHGALELASQGLQAADNAKCATCQKSSYALSNAKSYNGAAIALSIGG